MSRTRIHNLAMSLDGFATGEGQSLETPFGHAGHRLHQWMFATRFGAEMMGRTDGGNGVDNAFAQQFQPGIGAVPYRFKGVPSAKTETGETAFVPEALRPPGMR